MTMELTVLLVEDEPLLCELMTEALIEGFDVHAVPDAHGALRHLLTGARVDVLFTDLDLGNGMDGAALAQLVHEMRPQLPIVYTSGRRCMNQFEAVPGAAFLSKPYSLDEAAATLERQITRSTKRDRRAIPPSRHGQGTARASGYDIRR